jgi:hypothetical protein
LDGLLVATVVVTVAGALSVIGLGDEVQVPAGIVPVQETVTVPLKPPAGVKVSVNVAEFPAETVAEVEPPEATEMVMSVPSPERVTDCGLAGALSEIVMAPARGPVAVGVKVTVIVQEELGATPLECGIAGIGDGDR